MTDPHFSAHYVENLSFDREIPLTELIHAAEKKTLLRVLTEILGHSFQILDLQYNLIVGDETCHRATQKNIVLELEPIGFFVTEATELTLINTALQCILMQIRFAQKYLMASALHIEAIQEDYTTLCKEHEQLLESEAKYKHLCDTLDEKVKEQVATIETTQRKLFESEKMASIGHLAAGVAHEINNPIGFINSNLNTAKTYVSDVKTLIEAIQTSTDTPKLKALCDELDMAFVVDDFNDLLTDCIDGGKRVAEIVADLKLFSNIDAAEEVEVDIRPYIRSTCNVAASSIEKPVTIIYEPTALPNIKCRPGYIGQVILALIMNAADAVGENGKIDIHTSHEDKKLFITVQDNGPGIPKDVLKNVFDPFFTTKAVGDGKGLGLTSCKDIVNGHGGEISIESDGRSGTTVRFWLPI